jgi:hypothetical protein
VAEEYGQFHGNNFSTFGEDASGQLYVAGHNSGTIYLLVDNETNINNDDDFAGFRIIQAPFSRSLRLETGRNDRSQVHITLYDMKSTIIYETKTREASHQIDAGSASAGMYFLKIVIDGKTLVRKVAIGGI